MYVDGFVLVVPTKNLTAYKKIASRAGDTWIAAGALEYRECLGDDVDGAVGTSFPTITAARRTDTVVFSWIVYKDKKHRDAVNAKVMQDAWMKEMMANPKAMPFDSKRMSYGGFEMVVDLAASKARAKKAPAKAKTAAKKKAR